MAAKTAEPTAVRADLSVLPPEPPRPRAGQVIDAPTRETLPKPNQICAVHGPFYAAFMNGKPCCPSCLTPAIAEGTARLENPDEATAVISELRRRTGMLHHYVAPSPRQRHLDEALGVASPLDAMPPGPGELAETYEAVVTAHFARWRGDAVRKVSDLAFVRDMPDATAMRVVTAEALCEALGISDRTLRRWDGVKLPRSVVVPDASGRAVRYWNAFAVLQWLGAYNGLAGVRFS